MSTVTCRLALRTTRLLRNTPSTRQFASSAAPAQSASAKSTPIPSQTAFQAIRNDRTVAVTFPNGTESEYHHVWLRDHCRDPRSYHPATKQRLVDTAKIPVDLLPEKVEATDDGLVVHWSPEASTSSLDNATPYRSFYPYSFLQRHAYDPPLESANPRSKKVHWTSAIAPSLPTVTYEQVMESEEGVWEWVKRIDSHGFAFVSGIPSTPEATEALIRRIAFIRETHYGEFWDFTADLKHGDLAYSEQELRGHTDTTYFSDPCGLQLFHLLSPADSHKGGHNLLIDGFRAAAIFRQSHPELYHLFSTISIPSHASGTGSSSSPSGVHMTPLVAQPVFTHDPATGELVQVRWNGDDRGVVGGKAWEGKMELWFEAVRVWEGILRSEEAALWTVMETGTAVSTYSHSYSLRSP